MPMDRKRYPKAWPAISRRICLRAEGRCECAGECGKHAGPCPARHGDPLVRSGYFVVLTTAHLWRGPCRAHAEAGIKCDDDSHLKAMCQSCHLNYDMPQHVANARASRRAKKASGDLFG